MTRRLEAKKTNNERREIHRADLARKRMQRTRIITIFDRYNVFKSCRETTTILYAGHVCSLLGTRSSFALSILIIKSLTYKSF